MPNLFRRLKLAAAVSVSVAAVAAHAADTTAASNASLVVRVPANSLKVAPAENLPTLAPSAVLFGYVNVGDAASRQVSVTNANGQALSLEQSSLGAPFESTSTCPTTLAAGAACQVTVTFKPTAPGSASSKLTFTTSAGAISVPVIGAGGQGVPQLSAAALAFPNTNVNEQSDAQTLTLTNAGNASLGLTSLSFTGPFSLSSSSCGSALQGGESCAYSIVFSPTRMGSVAGDMRLSTSAGSKTVGLGGIGLQSAAETNVGSLDFQGVKLGTSSAGQGALLQNTGNTPLDVTSVTVSGPFSVSQNCPSSLPGASSCLANVTFQPVEMGPASGKLVFATALGNQSVTLSGNGLTAVPSLDKTTLGFGEQAASSVSPAQTITLANSGNDVLGTAAPSVTGPYSVSTTCAGPIAAGAACQYVVTFQPVAQGDAAGTLTIPTDAGNQTVSLTGTGLVTSGSTSLTQLDFGSQAVGTISSPQAATLQNTGNTALAFTGADVTGPFTVTHNCPASLSAGASCTLNATFAPTAGGAASGKIAVNTSGGKYSITLSGTGLLAVAATSVDALAFGAQATSTTSAAKTVSLSNTGNTALTLSDATVSAPFAKSASTCGASLAAGASCNFSLTFTPTTPVLATGTLTIPTSVGTKSVALSGTGLGASFAFSPGSIGFPTTALNATASTVVTITNSGNAAAVPALSTTSPFVTSACGTGAAIASGASCQATVTFTPTAAQTSTGTLQVGGSYNGARTVSLSGTGANPTFVLSGNNFAFGNVSAGSTVSATLVVYNTGAVPGTPVVTSTGGVFSATTCGSVAAGGSCTVTVRFTPTSQTSYSGALYVAGSSTGTLAASLSGAGYVSAVANGSYAANGINGVTVLWSPDHSTHLDMQGDCNLVVYKNGVATWNSGTNLQIQSCLLNIQGDGNLVIYKPNFTAVWSSGTGGQASGPTYLQLGNDGLLTMYAGNIGAPTKFLWQN
jgi:hypothetical protein